MKNKSRPSKASNSAHFQEHADDGEASRNFLMCVRPRPRQRWLKVEVENGNRWVSTVSLSHQHRITSWYDLLFDLVLVASIFVAGNEFRVVLQAFEFLPSLYIVLAFLVPVYRRWFRLTLFLNVWDQEDFVFFIYFWFNIVVICMAGLLQEICAQNLALSCDKWAFFKIPTPTCQFGCSYYYLALLLFDLGSFFMVIYVRGFNYIRGSFKLVFTELFCDFVPSLCFLSALIVQSPTCSTPGAICVNTPRNDAYVLTLGCLCLWELVAPFVKQGVVAMFVRTRCCNDGVEDSRSFVYPLNAAYFLERLQLVVVLALGEVVSAAIALSPTFLVGEMGGEADYEDVIQRPDPDDPRKICEYVNNSCSKNNCTGGPMQEAGPINFDSLFHIKVGFQVYGCSLLVSIVVFMKMYMFTYPNAGLKLVSDLDLALNRVSNQHYHALAKRPWKGLCYQALFLPLTLCVLVMAYMAEVWIEEGWSCESSGNEEAAFAYAMGLLMLIGVVQSALSWVECKRAKREPIKSTVKRLSLSYLATPRSQWTFKSSRVSWGTCHAPTPSRGFAPARDLSRAPARDHLDEASTEWVPEYTSFTPRRRNRSTRNESTHSLHSYPGTTPPSHGCIPKYLRLVLQVAIACLVIATPSIANAIRTPLRCIPGHTGHSNNSFGTYTTYASTNGTEPNQSNGDVISGRDAEGRRTFITHDNQDWIVGVLVLLLMLAVAIEAKGREHWQCKQQGTRDCFKFKSKEWISEDEINGFMDELNNEAKMAQYLVGESGSFNVVLL